MTGGVIRITICDSSPDAATMTRTVAGVPVGDAGPAMSGRVGRITVRNGRSRTADDQVHRAAADDGAAGDPGDEGASVERSVLGHGDSACKRCTLKAAELRWK